MNDIFKDIDWDKFHFLRAEYLWLWMPMAAIILLGIFMVHEKSRWKKHIAKHLQPYVIQKGTIWKSRVIHTSLILVFAIGFIGFLGPTWSEIKQPTKKLESQLVIALDLSQSMLATDMSPNRLERAKFKIRDFLEANPRAETALQVFAASTHTVVPFTTDYKIILDHLDGLKPSMMPTQGTGFSQLFENLNARFTDNIAEGKILLITDDLNDLNIEDISNFMQNNNIVLYIYPFATASGATVPSFRNAKYPLKIKGNTISSQLNTTIAQNLAAIDGVELVDVSLDASDVTIIAENISKHLIFEEDQKKEDEDWDDKGYWLVFPLAFLFLFGFRKGWALYSLALLMTLSSCNSDEAQKKPKSQHISFADLWYTKDYQAQKAFDQKDYQAAAEEFEDPIHKGVAYYKTSNFTKAKTAFEQDSSSSIGKYNLALTYAKLGDLKRSKQLFEEVLAKHPDMEKAKKNINQLNKVLAEEDHMQLEDTPLDEEKPNAKNKQNDSNEDFSGGGQEATKKDMEKERMEEDAATDKRMGKELDELPDDFKAGKGDIPNNILMRKVDDDPSLFLTRKFKYQIKHHKITPENTTNTW